MDGSLCIFWAFEAVIESIELTEIQGGLAFWLRRLALGDGRLRLSAGLYSLAEAVLS